MNWKTIDFVEGFENLYSVSDTGLIKRLDSQKELKLTKNHQGYLSVHFSNQKKRKRLRVSRLVAQAFIPNPENKPEVDHIDTNISNNNVSNLRWVTHQENMDNPLTLKNLEVNKGNKYFDKGYRDKILNLREKGLSYNKIAKILDCSKSTVHYHIKGKGQENNFK